MVNLALVGRGHWGSVYINTIKSIKAVTLSPKNILGREYKAALTNNYANKVHGVIIASPSKTHFKVAHFLIKQGYTKLLIEKPLTQNLTDALKLQKFLKNYPKVKIMVGHVQLYDPAYIALKKIAKKELGKIKNINYIGLKSPEVKDSTVLKDWGPHPIYIFLDIAGEEPKKVMAKPAKNDNIELTLKFPSGIVGVANIGTIHPKRKREIEIIGARGKLHLNEFFGPRKVTFTKKNNQKIVLNISNQKPPLENQIIAFANLIKSGKKPKSPLSQGIKVVKIIEEAEKSLSKNL